MFYHINTVPFEQPIPDLPPFLTIPKFLTPTQCRGLIEYGLAEPELPDSETGIKRKYRRVKAPVTPWIETKLAQAMVDHNVWGIHLSGFFAGGSLLRYNKGEGTRKHVDYKPHKPDRGDSISKLTAVIMLSNPKTDFTGGQFEICDPDVKQPVLSQGTLLIFPSYQPHGVLPVKSGSRWVMVWWAGGPPFI